MRAHTIRPIATHWVGMFEKTGIRWVPFDCYFQNEVDYHEEFSRDWPRMCCWYT
jgi:hypothetical protein